VGTRLRLWLSAVLGRRRFDDNLSDEMRFHLDTRAEHWRRQGVPPAEAARRARLEFGSPDKAIEQVRDVRRGLWFEQLRQDLRHGARGLLRRPLVTLSAVATLALGTGATATVFSLIDAALLRPLPAADASDLAHVYTSCRLGQAYCASSFPEFLDYRSRSRTFTDMAAFSPMLAHVSSTAGNWVARTQLVSDNYFPLLGMTPHTGRLLGPGDGDGEPAAVLDYDVWQSRFGGDQAVVGTLVRVSGASFRVVGVTPPGFRGTRLDIAPEVWIPLEQIVNLPGFGIDRLEERGARWIQGTVGRLASGATLAQAQADMALLTEALDASDPTRQARFITVEPARSAALPPAAAGDIRRFMLLLFGGVGATLFIACANVAGLQLARGAARRHELAMRRALGAGRGRLVRQLLAESFLLATVGTALGLLVARWAMQALTAYDLPGALPVAVLDAALGGRVLACAAVLLVITTLFGLVPAFGATRRLGAGARVAGDGGSLRGQRLLLGAQAAVTIVLLLGAGLFIRSLQNGLALDLGLTTQGVVMAQVAPGMEGYGPEAAEVALTSVADGLATWPGVMAASVSMRPPLRTGIGLLADEVVGYARGPDEEIRFEANAVQPGYFDALGIERLAGRLIASTDRDGTPLVGVISSTMARQYWAGRDPIGGRFRSSLGDIQVVGVVDDVRLGLTDDAEAFIYVPLAQHPEVFDTPATMTVLARASNVEALASSMRAIITDIDPRLPVPSITTLEADVATRLMPQRLGSALLSALAGLAVLLVAVGIVGTVAYGVARRRREIGIRLALGAQRTSVTRTMTRAALEPVALGLAAGAAATLLLGRFVAGFMYGVTPTDGPTFAAAVLLLGGIAAVAAWVPARRATRVAPSEVFAAE
jgi:predicted permease